MSRRHVHVFGDSEAKINLRRHADGFRNWSGRVGMKELDIRTGDEFRRWRAATHLMTRWNEIHG